MKVYTLSEKPSEKPRPVIELALCDESGNGLAKLVMTADQAAQLKSRLGTLLQEYDDLHTWGKRDGEDASKKYARILDTVKVTESESAG